MKSRLLAIAIIAFTSFQLKAMEQSKTDAYFPKEIEALFLKNSGGSQLVDSINTMHRYRLVCKTWRDFFRDKLILKAFFQPLIIKGLEEKQLDAVKALLSHVLSDKCVNRYHETWLLKRFYNCLRAQKPIVPVSQALLNESDLHHLCAKQAIEGLKCLIILGANMGMRKKDGDTPLHWAAGSCGLEVLKLLLSCQVDIEAEDECGYRPLHEAARNNSAEILSYLLENGADKDARTHEGLTPLHEAASRGALDAVKILLAHKANTAYITSNLACVFSSMSAAQIAKKQWSETGRAEYKSIFDLLTVECERLL